MAGLTGMKEICEHEGKSEPTVLKMVRELDYPARKLKGIWMSDTDLVKEWRQRYILGEPQERLGS